jgi:hypothetical protein
LKISSTSSFATSASASNNNHNSVIPGRGAIASPESIDDPAEAVAREKATKKWRRDWKIGLIKEQKPEWRDLYPGLLL